MTWDVKWRNYIGSMIGVSFIPLDNVTCHDMTKVWTAVNEHNCLKYQAIQISPAWESEKKTLYTELRACCLDGEGWSWIKVYDTHKDV